MQYKTIILELLRQRRSLHERLRKSDTLLETLNKHALRLRERHLEWLAVLLEATPGSEPRQLTGAAFELARAEWETSLATDSLPADLEPLSLDDAMKFLRRHSSPE